MANSRSKQVEDFAMDLIDVPTTESPLPQPQPQPTQDKKKDNAAATTQALPITLELLVDDREHDILKILADGIDINYRRQRLNAGDFIGSWKNQVIFVIERKTWADLSASFKDGRKENIEKLKAIGNTKITPKFTISLNEEKYITSNQEIEFM